jgi:hypothetical protein
MPYASSGGSFSVRFPPKLSKDQINFKKCATKLNYNEKRNWNFHGFFLFVPASIGGIPSPPRMPWSQPLMTYNNIHENQLLSMMFTYLKSQSHN